VPRPARAGSARSARWKRRCGSRMPARALTREVLCAGLPGDRLTAGEACCGEHWRLLLLVAAALAKDNVATGQAVVRCQHPLTPRGTSMFRKTERCPVCGGSGRPHRCGCGCPRKVMCDRCGGTGRLESQDAPHKALGQTVTYACGSCQNGWRDAYCPRCGGTGWVACEGCRGRKRVTRRRARRLHRASVVEARGQGSGR